MPRVADGSTRLFAERMRGVDEPPSWRDERETRAGAAAVMIAAD
jgi:hypothetical protein